MQSTCTHSEGHLLLREVTALELLACNECTSGHLLLFNLLLELSVFGSLVSHKARLPTSGHSLTARKLQLNHKERQSLDVQLISWASLLVGRSLASERDRQQVSPTERKTPFWLELNFLSFMFLTSAS